MEHEPELVQQTPNPAIADKIEHALKSIPLDELRALRDNMKRGKNRDTVQAIIDSLGATRAQLLEIEDSLRPPDPYKLLLAYINVAGQECCEYIEGLYSTGDIMQRAMPDWIRDTLQGRVSVSLDTAKEAVDNWIRENCTINRGLRVVP